MQQTERTRDFGSVIIAALILLFGVVVIWDTTTYSDFDSAVFPRIVSSGMIALCLLYIVLWLIGLAGARAGDGETEEGSWPRRVGLVILMLGGTLAMPWAGFILSSLVTFAALTLIAMYEPWTTTRIIVYPLVGIAVVLGFYVLFGELLRVPLPEGTWFDG
jgi:hypothetical protein